MANIYFFSDNGEMDYSHFISADTVETAISLWANYYEIGEVYDQTLSAVIKPKEDRVAIYLIAPANTEKALDWESDEVFWLGALYEAVQP